MTSKTPPPSRPQAGRGAFPAVSSQGMSDELRNRGACGVTSSETRTMEATNVDNMRRGTRAGLSSNQSASAYSAPAEPPPKASTIAAVSPRTRSGARTAARPSAAGAPTGRADLGRGRSRLHQLMPFASTSGAWAPDRMIPSKSNEAPLACPDWNYNNRNVVERLWARLKEWRAVATRYEKAASSFMGILCLAATTRLARLTDPELSRHLTRPV